MDMYIFQVLLHLLISRYKLRKLKYSVIDYVHSSVPKQTLDYFVIKILSLFGFIVEFN